MNRPRLRPTRTVIIAGTVTLVLTAGTAAATAAVMEANSPVSSSGVIDGCYTTGAINGSHVFVLQDQGTQCPRGTTPIQWNASGPSGAPGATGPSGPSGPAGPSGPPGPPGTTTTATATVTVTATGTSTLNPVGSGVCGGGNLGNLNPGNEVTAQGVNVGSFSGWWVITIDSGVSSFAFSVAGAAVVSAPAGTDVMNVYTTCGGTPVSGGSDATTFTGTTAGTYYVQVTEGSSGADGGYTLTASAS